MEENAEPEVRKRGPGDGKRGRLRKKFDSKQKVAFLKLLTQGYGREYACVKMAVSWRTLRNTYKDSLSFRNDIRNAVESGRQEIEFIAREYAKNNVDEQLPKALDRIDNARKMAQVRQDALNAKGGGSDAQMLTVAYKVAMFFADYVPGDKLTLLLANIPRLVSEATAEKPKALSPPSSPP